MRKVIIKEGWNSLPTKNYKADLCYLPRTDVWQIDVYDKDMTQLAYFQEDYCNEVFEELEKWLNKKVTNPNKLFRVFGA
jgi:hypothetical protein